MSLPPLRTAALAACLVLGLGSCGSIEFTRDTETSGHYVAKGFALTILSWDLPQGSLEICRENVADADFPNTQVTKARVWPYFGPLDWILDIIGPRWARVEGTWGFPGDSPAAEAATATR